jgi:hypothetical protein
MSALRLMLRTSRNSRISARADMSKDDEGMVTRVPRQRSRSTTFTARCSLKGRQPCISTDLVPLSLAKRMHGESPRLFVSPKKTRWPIVARAPCSNSGGVPRHHERSAGVDHPDFGTSLNNSGHALLPEVLAKVPDLDAFASCGGRTMIPCRRQCGS